MSFVWSERAWLWPGVGLLAALAVLVFVSYATLRGLPWRIRAACIGLKTLGFAALIFFLLDPGRFRATPKPGSNFFVVLADTSSSLRIKDEVSGRTRADLLGDVTKNEKWGRTLEDRFTVQRFSFDTRLRPRENFAALQFDGARTSLGAALHQIAQRYRDRPLAGVLVLTDGSITDSLPDGRDLPPVYPVILREERSPADLAVESVQVRSVVFEDTPLLIDVSLRAHGLKGRFVKVRLLDGRGRVAAEETRRPTQDDEVVAVRFTTRPEEASPVFYRVEAALEGGSDAIAENNAWLVAANRDDAPRRLLYVGGRPNWEHKFLQRALSGDPALKMASLIRVARKTAKWDFANRYGEVNPIFEGFAKEDEAEKPDESVFIRLQTADAKELQGGFPRAADELFGYETIIIDDAESELFTPDQMRLLHDYVSNRGGSLLMLGGRDSLEDGHYTRTPLGEILPVYLEKPVSPAGGGQFRFELTKEGMLQPWMRLHSQEGGEEKRLAEMPPFLVLNELQGLKPGAVLLAKADTETGKAWPGMAVQRFGHGRTAVIAFGDLWRWGMQNAGAREQLDKMWRQIVRGLLADVPRRATLEAKADPAASDQTTLLSLRVLGKDFHPAANPNIQLRVQSPDGKWTGAETQPGADPAEWVARVNDAAEGAWRAEAVVTDPQDNFSTKLATGWTRNPASEEFRKLQPDTGALASLAQATGGRLVEASKLAEWAAEMEKKPVPVMETQTVPLWHNAFFLLAAVALFSGEWALRRWKGLA